MGFRCLPLLPGDPFPPGSRKWGLSLGASVWGLRGSSREWSGPNSLTVLQCGDRVRLRTEVAVPDVIGSFQAQLVGGEGPQPEVERDCDCGAHLPPCPVHPGQAQREGRCLPGPESVGLLCQQRWATKSPPAVVSGASKGTIGLLGSSL